MKTLLAACSFAALGVMVLVLEMAPLAVSNPHPPPAHTAVNAPTPNPYLASPLYAITHFDSSQSDSTPYGPPRGLFNADPARQPVVYGGPTNIITLASTKPNYMWQVGTDRVSYVYKHAERWMTMATYQALADASNDLLPAIPDTALRAFGRSSAVGMTAAQMDGYLQGVFGATAVRSPRARIPVTD